MTTTLETNPLLGDVREETATERLTFTHVLRMEWIKLTGLRTTWITLGSVLALMVVFGGLAAAVSTGSVNDPQGGNGGGGGGFGDDPLSIVFAGVNFAVLIVGVLGALAGAREYSSGMITSTFAAVPRRLPVLWAKALVFVGVTLPVALVGVFGAFTLGMSILSASDAATLSLGDSDVLRAVLGQAVYLVGIGLLGLMLGLIMRGVASSIAVLVGGVLILPQFAGLLLPDSWNSVLKYLPSNAGTSFTSVSPDSSLLGPLAGAVMFAVWLAIALGGAAASITRRDV